MKRKLFAVLMSAIMLIVFIFQFSTMMMGFEVNRIGTKEKVMMLTFDDGPTTDDNAILDILEENNIHATFFGVGNNYEKYFQDNEIKKVEQRIIKDGDALANHSYSHDYYANRGDYGFNEFTKTNTLIKNIYKDNGVEINEKDIPIRMPYLQHYRGMDQLEKDLNISYFVRGYIGCDWNQGICGKKTILKQFEGHLKPGIIICAHTRAYAVEWLDEFIKYAKNKRYSFATFRDGDYSYKNYGKLVN